MFVLFIVKQNHLILSIKTLKIRKYINANVWLHANKMIFKTFKSQAIAISPKHKNNFEVECNVSNTQKINFC